MIIRVALPVPMHRLFDYTAETAVVGQRVWVSFGRQTLLGIVVELPAESDYPLEKLKPAQVLDDEPALPQVMMDLLRWSAKYYAHPLGEVMQTALPVKLRQNTPLWAKGIQKYALADGVGIEQIRANAHRQKALVATLSQGALTEDEVNQRIEDWRAPMKALVEQGKVFAEEVPCIAESSEIHPKRPDLTEEQKCVIQAIQDSHGFKAFLLDGVTGSGKTEVYLRLIEQALMDGKQVLVLIPEISLTSQMIDRFKARLQTPMAILHSGLNDSERHCAWTAASKGHARVVLGTRSALWTPMPDLGLCIIDEEHDGSYKQQEGFRYHARDVLVMRASQSNVPVVLGSATPSLETLHNAHQGLYQHLKLRQRATGASLPKMGLIDIRSKKLIEGVSPKLLERMGEVIQRGEQVLLFINRRGFSPVLMCHECGWTGECHRCHRNMTWHQKQHRLKCHHCGHEEREPSVCPSCGEKELNPVGVGTQRLEQAMQAYFPDAQVLRIDRDTTARKGEMDEKIAQAHSADILIGTQMLAKGHHFPNVTLVGILDVDQGLYGFDFRSTEFMAQLVIQVAGRAGRESKQGEVWLQTHYPEHPIFEPMLKQDYSALAKSILDEREMVGYPPFSHQIIIKASAHQPDLVMQWLMGLAQELASYYDSELEIMGPVPSPMEWKAGRFYGQLLLQAESRAKLFSYIRVLRNYSESNKLSKNIRYFWDVSPIFIN